MSATTAPAAASTDADRRRRRLAIGLAVATALLLLAGLAAGSDGWSPSTLLRLLADRDGAFVVAEIRAPRTVGAWLVGALLGLAGATAQGVFRNPLADPYLLGSASGASLGVVLVLAATAAAGPSLGGIGSIGVSSGSGGSGAGSLAQLGLVGAAFLGALLGVLLTLVLARGAQQTTALLLAGVVVGVVLASVGDLVTTAAPEALRGKQAFMLGSTGYLGVAGCGVLAIGLAATLPVARAFARGLDALSLGVETAASLGLRVGRIRLGLVAVVALATGVAVSQAGLVAFVGLVAPHLVRRFAPAPHGYTLVASAAAGGVLLLAADVLARTLIAPQEVPVGVLTALLGGGYLIRLLHRRHSG